MRLNQIFFSSERSSDQRRNLWESPNMYQASRILFQSHVPRGNFVFDTLSLLQTTRHSPRVPRSQFGWIAKIRSQFLVDMCLRRRKYSKLWPESIRNTPRSTCVVAIVFIIRRAYYAAVFSILIRIFRNGQQLRPGAKEKHHIFSLPNDPMEPTTRALVSDLFEARNILL